MNLFRHDKRPLGLKWRSSIWYLTLVVGFGITTDLAVYSIIIPVVPFQLEKLGFSSISALTAWLLFSYSLGLVVSTPPISWLTEKHSARRTPLLWGLLALAAFNVMFMEAPNYAVMVVARFIQGISSSVVWVVGLALLADTVPECKVGQQLGLAVSGLPLGLLAAPPIGGALYDHFGFRAPFIFGIICTAIDFTARWLIIERKDALKWGHDPILAMIVTSASAPAKRERTSIEKRAEEANAPSTQAVSADCRVEPAPNRNPSAPRRSELQVWMYMLKSKRTLAAAFGIFIYGIAYTGLEPTVPLRLQDLYNLNSSKVGLVFLAAGVPTAIASPLSGLIADRYGVEWITVLSFALTAPWLAVLSIKGPLALFIVCLAMNSFCVSAIVSPVTAELASIIRSVDGVGYGHVYGAFNIAFGIASTVGPLAAGQVYSHVGRGWLIVCCYSASSVVVASLIAFFFSGERPLASRTLRHTSVSGA